MSTVKLTSDTLNGTPTAGEVEYNGQFYATDSNASRAQVQRLVLATSQASTSGTSIDFTGIPSWVKRITVMFNEVSTNGSSAVQVQLGTSGGFVTSGYTAKYNATAITTGFGLVGGASTVTRTGSFVITNQTGNTWVMHGVVHDSSTAFCHTGVIALSGALTQLRITTVNGTDTFDAGSINLLYEG